MIWSIVIPCFNEENRIEDFFAKVQDFLKDESLDCEVIVVNDGSNDRTEESLLRIERSSLVPLKVINFEKNMGKGEAIKQGFLSARGDYVCTIDADGATSIKELKKAISIFNEGDIDIIIGSRESKSPGTRVVDRWQRRIMGRIFNFIVRQLTGLKFHDTQCGFKNYRRSSCLPIFNSLNTKGWAHDVEILVRAKQRSLKVKEVAVNWQAAEGSKVSPLRDSISMLMEIFLISSKNEVKK